MKHTYSFLIILITQKLSGICGERIHMAGDNFIQVLELLARDDQLWPEGEVVGLAALLDVNVLVDVIRHLPSHGQVILTLTAWSKNTWLVSF